HRVEGAAESEPATGLAPGAKQDDRALLQLFPKRGTAEFVDLRVLEDDADANPALPTHFRDVRGDLGGLRELLHQESELLQRHGQDRVLAAGQPLLVAAAAATL